MAEFTAKVFQRFASIYFANEWTAKNTDSSRFMETIVITQTRNFKTAAVSFDLLLFLLFFHYRDEADTRNIQYMHILMVTEKCWTPRTFTIFE